MITITTKEHLLYLMHSGYMRLSSFDLDFVQNLSWAINKKNEITSNQNELFDRILLKYKRQLLKQNITENFIKNLSWKCTVKESDPVFTSAYISIVEGSIQFKAPHKKKVTHAIRLGNTFKWDRLMSLYTSDYSAINLKYIVELAAAHYPEVRHCPIVTMLLAKLSVYKDVKFWDPTLYKTNSGLLCIAGANNYLLDAIKDLSFDISPRTISAITAAGINIDKSVFGQYVNDDLIFASKYIIDADWSNLDNIIEKLYMVGCDCLVINTFLTYKVALKKRLSGEKFMLIDSTTALAPPSELEKAKNPVLVVSGRARAARAIKLHGMHKILIMQDSIPIQLNNI